MKIITKKNPNAVPFEDLYEGMVFTFPENNEGFYMKTAFVGDEGDEFNCVNLDDGTFDCVSDDDRVIPVKAELHILD